MFLLGVQGWLADRNILILLGCEMDTQQRPLGGTGGWMQYVFAPSSRDKVGHKRERADRRGQEVEPIHVPDVYTDGSYAEEASREGFAGYVV